MQKFNIWKFWGVETVISYYSSGNRRLDDSISSTANPAEREVAWFGSGYDGRVVPSNAVSHPNPTVVRRG
jgi:hypothetical protein